MGGGTNFSVAFQKAHELMSSSAPGTSEVLLFLTDGRGGDPSHMIEQLLADHSGRLKSVTSIGLGGGADLQCLEQIGLMFSKCVHHRVCPVGDEASLVQIFVEAAEGGIVHT